VNECSIGVEGAVRGTRCASSSGEHESVGELMLIVDRRGSNLPDELMNEPLKVALVDTLTVDCVRLKNSIQTGFGSARLITTIEDGHVIITNLSNLVAVQIHEGNTITVSVNLSVARLPVAGVTNGSVHLTFDLTHWGWLR